MCRWYSPKVVFVFSCTFPGTALLCRLHLCASAFLKCKWLDWLDWLDGLDGHEYINVTCTCTKDNRHDSLLTLLILLLLLVMPPQGVRCIPNLVKCWIVLSWFSKFYSHLDTVPVQSHLRHLAVCHSLKMNFAPMPTNLLCLHPLQGVSQWSVPVSLCNRVLRLN